MTESKVGREPIRLLMRMNPPWDSIDDVRRFVEAFCSRACQGRASELALAAHELVQNAIANATTSEIELSLAVDAARDRVLVSVSNACTPEKADALLRRLAAMYREADAMLCYVRIMADSPTDVDDGLGLARIRCEARLDLGATFDGDRLTVTASGKLATTVRPMRGVVYG